MITFEVLKKLLNTDIEYFKTNAEDFADFSLLGIDEVIFSNIFDDMAICSTYGELLGHMVLKTNINTNHLIIYYEGGMDTPIDVDITIIRIDDDDDGKWIIEEQVNDIKSTIDEDEYFNLIMKYNIPLSYHELIELYELISTSEYGFEIKVM